MKWCRVYHPTWKPYQPTTRSSRSGQKVIWACPTGSEIGWKNSSSSGMSNIEPQRSRFGLPDHLVIPGNLVYAHKPLVNDGKWTRRRGGTFLPLLITLNMFCFCKSDSHFGWWNQHFWNQVCLAMAPNFRWLYSCTTPTCLPLLTTTNFRDTRP